jgi:iron(III) transport system substrate-binding protein
MTSRIGTHKPLQLLAFLSILAITGQAAYAQADIATYQGADRNQKLLEGAKKEGTLTIYSSATVEDMTALTTAFTKKYGVKTQVWRASSENIIQRAATEARGNRFDVDVFETDGVAMEAIHREKLLQEVRSPLLADLMPQAIRPHKEWIGDRVQIFTAAYNTRAIKKDDLPKVYDDLANPKWKGKLGIESKNDDWFATVVDQLGGEEKGLAFFRELVARNGISPRHGHTLLNNMVVSGEVPLALTLYNYMPEQAKKKGAPIDWFAIEPAVARSNAIGVTKNAPHPNAALLFYEYLLGPDGQAAMVSVDYVPTNTKVASPLKGVKIVQTDPIRTLDESPKWSKLFEETILRRAGQ